MTGFICSSLWFLELESSGGTWSRACVFGRRNQLGGRKKRKGGGVDVQCMVSSTW